MTASRVSGCIKRRMGTGPEAVDGPSTIKELGRWPIDQVNQGSGR